MVKSKRINEFTFEKQDGLLKQLNFLLNYKKSSKKGACFAQCAVMYTLVSSVVLPRHTQNSPSKKKPYV